MRITFTAELSVSDLFLKTVHGGLVSTSVDTVSYFLLPISQLCGNKSFLRNAVLPRHANRVSDSIGTASALLASASAPSSIRRGLGRLGRVHQGIALGVYKPVGSTLPLLALWGSREELIADDGRRLALS